MLAGVISVRINAKLGTSLSATHLFEHPTVERLAATIDSAFVANLELSADLPPAIFAAPFTPEEKSQVGLCITTEDVFVKRLVKDQPHVHHQCLRATRRDLWMLQEHLCSAFSKLGLVFACDAPAYCGGWVLRSISTSMLCPFAVLSHAPCIEF